MPSARPPVVTIALIAAHALFWFAERPFLNGALPSTALDLAGEWRHVTWLHIGANLWCLWIFGENVEGRIGRLPFFTAYLAFGTGTLVIERALALQGAPLLGGASGATAGVMGIYFALYPRARVLAVVPSLSGWDLFELPAAALLAVWFAAQLLSLNVVIGTGGPPLAAIAVSFAAGAATGAMLARSRHYPTW